MKKSTAAQSERLSHSRKETAIPARWAYGAAMAASFSAMAYELLLANYATYLLGATIFQYSLVISMMMASMGFGALLTHSTKHRILETFVAIEFALALLAMIALPVLYVAFAVGFDPRLLITLFVFGMGTAVGMEIPLLNRMNGGKEWLTHILFFDYLGGFLGAITFPILLVPLLGLFRIAAVMSLLNAALALTFIWMARKQFRSALWLPLGVVLVAGALGFLVNAERLRRYLEWTFFQIQ